MTMMYADNNNWLIDSNNFMAFAILDIILSVLEHFQIWFKYRNSPDSFSVTNRQHPSY